MGKLAQTLQTLLPLPSKQFTRHLSFSRLPKLQASKSSPGLRGRVGSSRRLSSAPPKGHLPIRVVNSCASDGLLYFVKTEHLNHPIIVDLLQRAAEEYGYSRAGVLEITCDTDMFEDILYILDSSH
ncbi:hypothetical protein KP509_11G080000 [Ceratopteris richardii]|uniref:Uncharacterized protein n=1 Tax=Ceratopteris richardii TaxID=49495 RepID=A0A8T2TT50_CERRI|nr:hypothetical protein KP509_11G080000 [Ceratopteris richardii]